VSAADGRYAPSPTGPLHLGNLRTALLAWCFARSRSGRFVLRIEDLDTERSRPGHEAAMLADLARLGIDWDGTPARQSEHLEEHRGGFETLRSSGRTYRCWCTRAEIREAALAPHPRLRGAAGGAEGFYPGTCRELSARERAARERAGRPAAWRLDAQAELIAFEDRLGGSADAVVDDFVIWRGDPQGPGGGPAYNLAVVVDDAAAGIGEVVRGDDLLETTPRQILLARLLGLPVPRYAHVPLVLGADGRRLAKRHGAVTLDDRLALGESIATVVGWMASSVGLAGHGARLSARELLATFDPARLRREPTVWADPGLGEPPPAGSRPP
jgi:glutamyl-tRNA synthetase